MIFALKMMNLRFNEIEVWPYKCFKSRRSAEFMPILLPSSVPIRSSALIMARKYDKELDDNIKWYIVVFLRPSHRF